MQIIDLNGTWHIASTDGKFSFEGTVPGSVFYDLERTGYWGEHDVFYRENNQQCVAIADREFVYRRTFDVPREFFAAPNRVFLEADGLDTLADITINGREVAHTENMFRRYRFEVSSFLQAGANEIEVHFNNVMAEIARQQKRRPLWNPVHTVDGATHVRKSHCSFGWDWGPQIPDIGIWRPIRLVVYPGARLREFHAVQHHADGAVQLEFSAAVEQWHGDDHRVHVTVTSPRGEAQSVSFVAGEQATLEIAEPQLWWPNGYGEQPLYHLEAVLETEGRPGDRRSLNLGLRTLRLEREKDAFGESFQFSVNGMAIFARGANWIPEDIYLTRPDRAATERRIRDALAANFNCLRVWGGGVYPDDTFYALCDAHGLIVWQDLMFACGVYDVNNPDFLKNIKLEVIDNLQRIRHHACLGLICGNNEMEMGFETWDFEKTDEMRAEYLEQYEKLFPRLVQQHCPYLDYWPSSPSSGGNFDQPNADDRGNVHFWQVWHGNKPFTEYRKHYFRFLSEFGFESFPAMKTIHTFTEPEDRNIFSPVMEDHQRCTDGNGKILMYLSQYFRYPKDFASLVYVSQLSQAEAMRSAVEHLRRHRGRCMGTIYWQFNDNWPAVSWSSVDYFGRWKALHYVARRMYDPVLVSCDERGHTAALHVSNETTSPVAGVLRWRLLDLWGNVLAQDEIAVEIPALASRKITGHDFSPLLQDHLDRERYLSYAFTTEDGKARHGTVCFVPYKHLSLVPPGLAADVCETGEHFEIRISAKTFAKFVALDLREGDVIFSDNFFDLDAGQTRVIRVSKEGVSQEQLAHELEVRSLFESY